MTLLVAALCATFGPLAAAPFTPASDATVVEVLPSRTEPAVRQVDSLRRQLVARPDDAALRVDVARRYFDLAMAQGDPRFVGYARAALQPLAGRPDAHPGYWLALGMLQQYGHDFAGALDSLGKAAAALPESAEPHAWRAAIFMVQARYAEALRTCDDMATRAPALMTAGCRAYARAATGQTAQAYADLTGALTAHKGDDAGLRLWTLTRLAEMAIRLQRPQDAERHFKAALQVGITDQFLLGAYADFLLAQGRAAEVISLLSGWEQSDILLLRLALAGKAAAHAQAGSWASQLRERFAAARQRGDGLHEQEAARFELDIESQPAKALPLAVDNYRTQKEPRDAEILMRAARAAKDARAARPAVEWLQSSGFEDASLKALAADLIAAGALK